MWAFPVVRHKNTVDLKNVCHGWQCRPPHEASPGPKTPTKEAGWEAPTVLSSPHLKGAPRKQKPKKKTQKKKKKENNQRKVIASKLQVVAGANLEERFYSLSLLRQKGSDTKP